MGSTFSENLLLLKEITDFRCGSGELAPEGARKRGELPASLVPFLLLCESAAAAANDVLGGRSFSGVDSPPELGCLMSESCDGDVSVFGWVRIS